MLSFGVTVLPDPPYQRLIELTKLAEAHGFEYGWTYDSHVLWQESMPVMALLADQTSTIKLGHMFACTWGSASRNHGTAVAAPATPRSLKGGPSAPGSTCVGHRLTVTTCLPLAWPLRIASIASPSSSSS